MTSTRPQRTSWAHRLCMKEAVDPAVGMSMSNKLPVNMLAPSMMVTLGGLQASVL